MVPVKDCFDWSVLLRKLVLCQLAVNLELFAGTSKDTDTWLSLFVSNSPLCDCLSSHCVANLQDCEAEDCVCNNVGNMSLCNISMYSRSHDLSNLEQGCILQPLLTK